MMNWVSYVGFFLLAHVNLDPKTALSIGMKSEASEGPLVQLLRYRVDTGRYIRAFGDSRMSRVDLKRVDLKLETCVFLAEVAGG